MRLLLAALSVLLLQTVAFEPVQPDLFGAGGTLVNAWADYDGDDDPDLFVGFDGAPNRLYRNGNGTFVDVAMDAGIADARSTRAAAWGDFDEDGDPDLLVGFTPGAAGSVLRLYRNTKGKFADVTTQYGLGVGTGTVRQPVWIDFDADGDLDLFVAFRDRANALFLNDLLRGGSGTFRDVAAEVGLADTRKSVGAVWFDVDQDHDLDLAVANMDGDANGLFRNDGGRFTDVADSAGFMWGGRTPGDKANGTVRVCAADVNNDGRLDLFAANYGKNGLFLNGGNGKFKDVSAAWGIDIDSRYDTCAFEDFDHDGRIDLYVNGTVTGGTSYPDYLFRNMGGRFVDVTPQSLKALHADHGAEWADFDNDGDVDLALTGAQPNGMHFLMRNMLPPEDAARSLNVRVVDGRGLHTLAGSEVRVFEAGRRGRLLGTRILDSGSGYDAQSDLPVHFGLPPEVKTVVVEATIIPHRATMRSDPIDPRTWRGKVFKMNEVTR
jgi:FG-GAP-like repeat